jgi:hypothetical protein
MPFSSRIITAPHITKYDVTNQSFFYIYNKKYINLPANKILFSYLGNLVLKASRTSFFHMLSDIHTYV